MLPSLGSLSLNGRTCQPCRRAASIGANKQDFLDNAEAKFIYEITCSICLERLENESYENETPPWARSPAFRAAVFGPGKSSEDLNKAEWSVVAVCNNENPHVLHIGCAQKWFAKAWVWKLPSCPECRQPWDKDLLKAFIDNQPAFESNEWTGVEYYDFEYERARIAVAEAEARGLDAISQMSSGNPRLDAETTTWATSYGEELRARLARLAGEARENLEMYRVPEYHLQRINPVRLLQGVNQLELSQRAMNTVAVSSIKAYISTEASMILARQRPQWVGVEFDEKDLIRPVMQYYFYVCSALARLCPDHFFLRYKGVEGDAFDRTTQRGYYLRYPSDLQYPHDEEDVTEQQFFELYPDSVANPYEVESTYHVSFLGHRLRERVVVYLDAYGQFSREAENILINMYNPLIYDAFDVSEARKGLESTGQTLLDKIYEMRGCAAEALNKLRKEAESPSGDEDTLSHLVERKVAEVEEFLTGIAKLVKLYKVPDGEKIMRKRSTLEGTKPDFSSSKVFFEEAHASSESMQYFFHAGLRSVAEDCNSVVKNAVNKVLAKTTSQNRVAEDDVSSSDSDSDGDSDDARVTRQRIHK